MKKRITGILRIPYLLFSFLFYIALLFSAGLFAQPNQYEDFQRAIAEKRSSAAYLEKIETDARKPNLPYNSAGIDRKAFYNTINKNALPPLSAAAQKNVDAFMAEKKATSDRTVEMMLRRMHLKEPFVNRLHAAGIADTEADFIARQIVSFECIVSNDYVELLKPAEYYEYYKLKKQTATYDELMLTISEFENNAPGTAFLALKEMKLRFPEHEKELDALCLARLYRYFEGDFTRTDETNRHYSFTIKMVDEYLAMEEKYPEIANAFLAGLKNERRITDNPYKCKLQHLWRDNDNKSSKAYKQLQKRYAKVLGEK